MKCIRKGASTFKEGIPKVSIIIVNYNGSRWLQLCIPALLNTDYPAFEIILVDNGSMDQSVAYLRKNWGHCISIIELRDNLGFAEGCNIGVRESRGDIIAFLNNDVEVDKNWLKAAVETLLSAEKAGAVQSKIMQYHERMKIDCLGLSVDRFGLALRIGHGEIDNGQYDHLAEIWASDGGAMIIWKELLIDVGLFDHNFFMYYEAVDLGWRIRLSGYTHLLAHSSIVYHIGSATSKAIPSSFILFHSTKNLIASWLKNYSFKTLFTNCPLLIMLILGSLLLEIKNGRFALFTARVKSIVWILRNLNYLLKQRHNVQHQIRNKQVSDRMLFANDNGRKSSNVLYILGKLWH